MGLADQGLQHEKRMRQVARLAQGLIVQGDQSVRADDNGSGVRGSDGEALPAGVFRDQRVDSGNRFFQFLHRRGQHLGDRSRLPGADRGAGVNRKRE